MLLVKSFGFILLLLALPCIVYGNAVYLPKTGQTTCYNSLGKEIACTGTNQDGEAQYGIDWPDPRFMDNTDGTITDKLTGLMWLKDANCFGNNVPYHTVNDVISKLNSEPNYYGCSGYTINYDDWRLPDINELSGLINLNEPTPSTWLNQQGFKNAGGVYASSTTQSYYANPSYVTVYLYADFSDGGINMDMGNPVTVLPVRAGQRGNIDLNYPANTWRTWQDEGENFGVSWPVPRFIDKGDGTVIDSLTSLMWLKDANCFDTQKWQDALNKVSDFNSSSASYNCQNYMGNYKDWRLPNRKELVSLMDFSKNNPALPGGNPFINVQATLYWSSSTRTYGDIFKKTAWSVNVAYGEVAGMADAKDKELSSMYVWPVRLGKVASINLFKGWNFISTSVQPISTDIAQVLRDISNNVFIAWGFNNDNKAWLKYRPNQSGSLNMIEAGKGYWLYAIGPTILRTSGSSPVTSVHLGEGWNLTGFNKDKEISASDSLVNINGKWSILWTWDNDVWSGKHYVLTSLPVPGISTLKPKKAYWIKIREGSGTVDWAQ